MRQAEFPVIPLHSRCRLCGSKQALIDVAAESVLCALCGCTGDRVEEVVPIGRPHVDGVDYGAQVA